MAKFKKTEHFGCKTHRRVFFSQREMLEHVREKCHIENIVKLDSDDFLDHWGYNMIEEHLENTKMSEKEKQGIRDLYLW